MEWYRSKVLSKCFLTTTDWNIAWRKKTDDFYHVVNNPMEYWLADPLLFEFQDNQYIFVEAFDKNKNIGKIAVLTDDRKGFSNFKVILEMPYHLSYPFVFSYSDDVYMIPETSGNETIELYKAVVFPYKWEKEIELEKGKFVDTTLFFEKDCHFTVYSYDMKNKQMCIGDLDMDQKKLSFTEKINDSLYTLRGGGKVFFHNNKCCRPVQQNTFFYGRGLTVISCENNEKLFELMPEKINVDSSESYRRLHTYSCNDRYEVIDLSDIRFDFLKIPKRLLNRYFNHIGVKNE